jgi:hypothetical protein
MQSKISAGMVARDGIGCVLCTLDDTDEVKDLLEIEEDEFRRRRMVFGSVFDLEGITGGINDRIGCLAVITSGFSCSSTGLRENMTFSLSLPDAFPSI